ncbi:sterol desaturase [Hesseltinella vesiculosa]|uniref:Sterol desaturase n=1 Tax=Hesseltinella vesiculosa TaxID=101127 RepID=A0A1X2GNP3_9FUNG|nr:sterol desaturase [Hesseltinella vesiculosa]
MFFDHEWLEQHWEQLYAGRNPFLVTGLFAFTLHEFVYFVRFVPFLLCDFLPYFQKYKLQPKHTNTYNDYWNCTKHVLLQHFFYEGPLIFFFHPMASYLGMSVRAPLPKWEYVLPQVVLFFIIEDAYHYGLHRLMHWPPLYKKIHKVHHKYAAPFGLAAEYAHPLETSLLGLGTIGGPLLYHVLVVHYLHLSAEWHLHLFTMLTWMIVRLIQAVDAHSGYDFPWSLHHFIPFWAGAEHHDYHHQAFTDCYASSFRYLDYILGTDKKFRAYRARVSVEKKKWS